MWKTLQEIRKFTPKTEMDRILGVSPVQIEDRPAWYYGGGFVLHFSPVRFRVEGIQRVEYGGPGEYVVGGWHFPDAGTLKLELGLTCFDAADAAPLEEDIVDGVITYQSTFQEILVVAETIPQHENSICLVIDLRGNVYRAKTGDRKLAKFLKELERAGFETELYRERRSDRGPQSGWVTEPLSREVFCNGLQMDREIERQVLIDIEQETEGFVSREAMDLIEEELREQDGND